MDPLDFTEKGCNLELSSCQACIPAFVHSIRTTELGFESKLPEAPKNSVLFHLPTFFGTPNPSPGGYLPNIALPVMTQPWVCLAAPTSPSQK